MAPGGSGGGGAAIGNTAPGRDTNASDGNVTVTLAYTSNALLLRPSRIEPTITGLGGHAPTCTLASGLMPAGMTLNSDCSVTGTPLLAGTFPMVVRLAASGASNTLDWYAPVLVLGPSVIYSVPTSMMVGTSYDLPTLNNFWTAGPGDTLSYSVSAGSLPDGLAIDRTTGRITGTVTTEGQYSFEITAELVNGGRTATTTSQGPEFAVVRKPLISYSQAGGFAGLPFLARPDLPSGAATYIFSTTPALPAGLTIAPNTGVISGRPSAISRNTDYRIDLTGTTPTGTFTNFSNFNMTVESPVYVNYPSTIGRVGAPLSMRATLINNSNDPLTGITYSYALHPGASMPPGLSLDASSGEISGTPTTSMTLQAIVDVTVSVYGTTFVVEALADAGVRN